MADLKDRLSQAVAAAFAAEGLDGPLGRVGPSDRPDLADFQSNGALAAAKAARANPRELASRVAARLEGEADIAAVEVAGPGFINLRVSDAALTARAAELAADSAAGLPPVAAPRRVLIDYAGPNVAKPMHVGHLRSSIIGESLKRLFRARGDEVLGDAHFGDWGFQMGLLIVAVGDEAGDQTSPSGGGGGERSETTEGASPLERIAPSAPEPVLGPAEGRTRGGRLPRGGRPEITLEDLERLYPLAAGRAKTDLAYRDRARRATAELQAGRADYRALWSEFVRVSRTALEREFHALSVDFDLWKGESDADPLIPAMVDELAAKGLLEDDQGARIVRIGREGDKRELPPLLVISSEGSAMYGTTDLATIVDRRNSFDPQLILYVVDQRQADHFLQVFRAAELAGYAAPGELEHIGFGTMNGLDGKPFKTREGGVLKLHDLITQATDKARERLREADLGAALPAAEFEATAHKVAVAALKFADLQNFRGTSYVFDLDRFTSFEGKTGPYLLYQAVRIKSLLRKAKGEGAATGPIAVEHAAERELALTLDAYAQAAVDAYDRRAPNALAEHAYRLAQSFSRFYAACPVLAADTPERRGSRLALAGATLRQLEGALGLLGIETPERM